MSSGQLVLCALSSLANLACGLAAIVTVCLFSQGVFACAADGHPVIITFLIVSGTGYMVLSAFLFSLHAGQMSGLGMPNTFMTAIMLSVVTSQGALGVWGATLIAAFQCDQIIISLTIACVILIWLELILLLLTLICSLLVPCRGTRVENADV